MKNYILLLLPLVMVIACGKETNDKKAQLDELKKQADGLREQILKLESELAAGDSSSHGTMVNITEIQPAKFNHYIDVQAKIDGEENVSVSPEIPGTVSRILVKVGDPISPGTVLAELDNAIYQSSMDELLNQRDFLNTLYLKQKALWDQQIGTEIQYLTAKNNLEGIDRKIKTVRKQIEQTRIKSPIRGNVDAVDIKIGQSVAPGMPCVRVVNFSKLKVKAEVAESYINLVKKGDPVLIEFPDLKKTVEGKLSYSGKVIDPLNRTFTTEVALPADPAYRPNMIAVLRISDYSNDKALTLPVNVVQNTPEGSYVFVSETKDNKQTATKRTVKTGRTYKGTTEIVEGLNPGEKVVTTGFQDLVDGMHIQN